jgi:23S rRNA A2030 N6-methylase RlmJ
MWPKANVVKHVVLFSIVHDVNSNKSYFDYIESQAATSIGWPKCSNAPISKPIMQ